MAGNPSAKQRVEDLREEVREELDALRAQNEELLDLVKGLKSGGPSVARTDAGPWATVLGFMERGHAAQVAMLERQSRHNPVGDALSLLTKAQALIPEENPLADAFVEALPLLKLFVVNKLGGLDVAQNPGPGLDGEDGEVDPASEP